jgi:hypothetical protein
VAAASKEPLAAPTGTASDKINSSVMVLGSVSQYLDLKPTAL